MSPLLTCFSQDSLSTARFDYTGSEFGPRSKHRNTLSGYLAQYNFKENPDFFKVRDTVCEAGVTKIRFKVKSKVGITEVACTKSTNPAIGKIFKDAVKHSSPYWTARGDTSLWYIQPIMYGFDWGCKGNRKRKLPTNADQFLFDDDARLKDPNYSFDDSTMKDLKYIMLPSFGFTTGVDDTSSPENQMMSPEDRVKRIIGRTVHQDFPEIECRDMSFEFISIVILFSKTGAVEDVLFSQLPDCMAGSGLKLVADLKENLTNLGLTKREFSNKFILIALMIKSVGQPLKPISFGKLFNDIDEKILRGKEIKYLFSLPIDKYPSRK